jgi:hypothetical protein
MNSIAHTSTDTSADTSATRRSAKRLSVYLNGHLADETRGLEFVKRAISENEGTPLRAFMEVLSWELEEDRESLARVMGELGVRRRRVRVVLARLADQVERLKPDGRLTGHSPLSLLVELESLHRGVEGKIDMWKALRHSVRDRVDGIDFDQLIRRAERQAEEIERRRLDVAANALDEDAVLITRGGSTPAQAPRGLRAAPSAAPAGS